ncbi:MAG: hypothetical protein LBL85_05345 [Methanocalculaceae archaeon]|nr:hypothetical protein [Methanocalculaceae archaeon]
MFVDSLRPFPPDITGVCRRHSFAIFCGALAISGLWKRFSGFGCGQQGLFKAGSCTEQQKGLQFVPASLLNNSDLCPASIRRKGPVHSVNAEITCSILRRYSGKMQANDEGADYQGYCDG